MAKEVLVVPEYALEEVIAVLRAGLEHSDVSQGTREALLKWCADEEAYLAEVDA